MKKSKIALLYSLIIIIFTFFFVWIKNRREPTSIYREKETIFEGYIEEIKLEEDTLKMVLNAKEKLLLTYKVKTRQEKERIKEYKLGSYIKGKGKIDLVETNRNFANFSYRKYLWSKKIYRKCEVEKITLYKETNKIHYKIKNRIIKKINSSKNKAYYYTFLLGNTSFIDKKVKDSYLKNGISHLFAISGMHISLFSILLLKIIKKMFKKEWICYSLCIFFLLFYAFLTNFTPSVLRSTIFFIVVTIKRILKLKIDIKILYIIITCLFLLYNPYFIYHTGFLYSFTISFFLLCYGKKFCQNKFFYDIFIILSISFLASFPIQINTNFEVNIISILINIVFVPFISHIIFPFTLFCFFIPLDFILSYLLYFLEQVSLFLSSFSVYLIFPKMHTIEIIIYYSFLIITLSYSRKTYIFVLFLFYLYIKPIFYNPFLTMIDVNQGDSFFLHANHKNILIDTGGKKMYSQNKREYYKGKEIILYLKSKGIRQIDTIFLSHGDIDHMQDALYLTKNFPIKKVVLNEGKNNNLEKELLKYVKKNKIEYKRISKGKIKVGKNIFYALNKKNSENENKDSLILYTKIKKYNILFMGDADIENEKYLLNAYNLPKMDILKIGHHGSKTSTRISFLKKVKPVYSLISVGKENKYGHPSKEVLHNLKKVNSKIYRTDIHGMVEIIFKEKMIVRSLLR